MDEPIRQRLRSQLLAIEPDYGFLASHGDEAVPQLREWVEGDDTRLAERALVLAAHIGSSRSLELVREAASSPHGSLRAVAAANAVRMDPVEQRQCLESLLRDAEPSIRRLAVRAVGEAGDTELTALLAAIEKDDPDEVVRRAAAAVITRLRP